MLLLLRRRGSILLLRLREVGGEEAVHGHFEVVVGVVGHAAAGGGGEVHVVGGGVGGGVGVIGVVAEEGGVLFEAVFERGEWLVRVGERVGRGEHHAGEVGDAGVGEGLRVGTVPLLGRCLRGGGGGVVGRDGEGRLCAW